jgi:hypothetical protein
MLAHSHIDTSAEAVAARKQNKVSFIKYKLGEVTRVTVTSVEARRRAQEANELQKILLELLASAPLKTGSDMPGYAVTRAFSIADKSTHTLITERPKCYERRTYASSSGETRARLDLPKSLLRAQRDHLRPRVANLDLDREHHAPHLPPLVPSPAMPERNLDAANEYEQNDLWDIEKQSTLNGDLAPPWRRTQCCCSG